MLSRSYMKRQVGKQVVVHTTAGSSIRGVLSTVANDVVVLEAPQYLGEAQTQDDLEGRVTIERVNVDFTQVL